MPLTGDSTVLIPVDVSSDVHSLTGLQKLAAGVEVVLLGYYPVPDQAVPAQLRTDHEADANRRLDALAAEIDQDVTRLVVFTHDRDETIDRVAEEHGCDAVATVGEFDQIDRVFVPLRGAANVSRICSLVGDVLAATGASVTLFHAVADGDREQGESLLDEATEQLVAAGIDRSRVSRQLEATDDPAGAILVAAEAFDLIVVGETEPSLRERILGRVPARIVDDLSQPTFVVRQP